MSGHVLDVESGHPVSGALVELEGDGRAMMTDEAGRFRFGNLGRGPWKLVASQLGYITLKLPIDDMGETQVLVRLIPDPIVLEGLAVTLDRLEQRRKRIPFAVTVLDREALAFEISDASQIIERRSGFSVFACSATYQALCARIRGSVVLLRVFIDDIPRFGGFDELAVYQGRELYSVEVIPLCKMVRLYTTNYMEHLAKTGQPLRRLRGCGPGR